MNQLVGVLARSVLRFAVYRGMRGLGPGVVVALVLVAGGALVLTS